MGDWRLILALSGLLAACSPAAEEPNVVANATEEPAVEPTNLTEAREMPATPTRASVFTELDMAKCRVLEENKEEGPYWLRRCPGHAGWQLDWSESDLRQGLTLLKDGRETELRLSDLVAKGAFNSLGKTVEWRGADASRPNALIVRMNVAAGPEPGLPDISRLAVVRLTETPCLVAVVEPGPGQNEKARTIADEAMPECLSD